ncbi:glycosyltransferase family protein [Chitinophaga sancti]|uniref:Glycosyltransferase n=1 Tax=Chitinophaga sancti TaxID=1004 RepID=A0A1K1RDP8_9BACT|nr:glycosyltransferase [Chitinophaga sancti]WQD65684.1 glycosyltransferase [Chitinophaga sancti]WQG88694.1 glycosyltransferase [Chitinophaga sancti]SFW70311.1 Glycosyltransferase involved in cell wall bisynthesis [Chitinophaga sancti]
MKILVAGDFEPDYNRTKIILDGLRTIPAVFLSFYNYKEQSKWNLAALRKACKEADVIFLPSFTHQDVAMIKFLSGKPVLFDPLISRYLSKVFDYKKVAKFSPRALKNYLKDKIAMQLADLVICDTAGHRDYYHRTFNIPLRKLHVVPVGVNTDEFQPAQALKVRDTFVVGFYGGFIPLQGTRMIVETAKVLKAYPDIHFRLIGNGFEFKVIQQLVQAYQLSNISLAGWVAYDQLAEEMNHFDICLGIFGETLKADLVIPNKIFHYAALEKAIITKESAAIREVFTDGRDILLTENKAEAIAEKILLLKNDQVLRGKLARGAYETVSGRYSHRAIGQMVYELAKQLMPA